MDSRFRWTLTNLKDNSSEVLLKDPYGFENASLKLERDQIYSGVFVDYTFDFGWHCNGGGKDFIDNVYETEDVNGEIEVLVELNCDGTGSFVELYRGRLNLSSYATDTEVTTCNIERSNLYTKLKAREEMSVDLESTISIGGATISSIDTENISMPSMEIKYEYEMRIPASEDAPWQQSYIDSFYGGWNGLGFFTFLGGLVKNDFDGGQAWIDYESWGDEPTDSLSIQDDQFIAPLLIFDGLLNGVAVDFPITINYEYDFSGYIIDNVTNGDQEPPNFRDVQGFKLMLYYGRWQHGSNTPMNAVELFNSGFYDGDPFVVNYNIQGNGSFTLLPGHRVYLAWLYNFLVPTGSAPTIRLEWNSTQDQFFKMSSVTKYRESECKQVMVHEAFNQVCDSISDKNTTFYSDFYGRIDSDKVVYPIDGCGSMKAITNGLNIREFPDRSIFCNLKELFNSCNAIDNIGLTIENDMFRVEKLEYFYDKNTQILSLSNPVKVDRKVEQNLYISKILLGYSKWETEFKGGLDEPNTRHEYSTEINTGRGVLQRFSDYMASSYAIELTRRKSYRLFPTEDFRYDETNFFVQLFRGAYGKMVELQSDAFISTSNMTARATAYNLRLTPLRMLMAQLNRITSALQIINGFVRFVKGEGNFLFSSALIDNGCQEEANGIEYAENDSITWNDPNIANAVPLWLPVTYSFQYPLTFSQLQTIKANPNGYIQVVDEKGNTLNGFILTCEYAMKTGITDFVLLKVYE